MYSTGFTPLSSTALTNCSVITSGVFTCRGECGAWDMGARDDAMCHVITSGVFTLPSFFRAPQK